MLHRFGLTTSSFRELREEECLYVDKTRFLYTLIRLAKRSFLARPRRFGKSLLVSTLESILKGEKELFDGLWISNSDYHWEKHAVIKLNFSMLSHDSVAQLEKELILALEKYATLYDIVIPNKVYEANSSSVILSNLCEQLYKKYGQIALLVDEYDHPVLHSLDDPLKAEKILNALRAFFTTVKALDTQIKFFFATGVSALAKAGIFSGMNNLRILSLDNEYGAMCGYTQQEVDHHFAPYIEEWAAKESTSPEKIREKLKAWYNGYQFGQETEAVYNPFSLMHAIEKKVLKNFWFESGNPRFLIEELKRRQVGGENAALFSDGIETNETELGVFEIYATTLEALLFQTGYLTIKGTRALETPMGHLVKFKLSYPNYEVATSFQLHLLTILARLNRQEAFSVSADFAQFLFAQDVSGFVKTIKTLCAQVPYQLHIPRESFYHALLQTALGAAGFNAQSEYATDQGRIDLLIDIRPAIYIIEIKFDALAESALSQIKEKKYYERFLSTKKPIILVGLSFQKEPGKFDVSWKAETINSFVK